MKVSLLHTADGSDTLYNHELDESYHSKFGAISESLHVFIKNGLEQIEQKEITIFEVGFGTGLNALLSAIYAVEKQQKINYTAIEKYPLHLSVVAGLNYCRQLHCPETLFQAMHEYKWGLKQQVSDFFTLIKIKEDLLDADLTQIDKPALIFFDAFSPVKQPEMWQPEIFEKLFKLLAYNGKLLTYSASGKVKTAMRQAGFEIKRLKGPAGKHHMLLATKLIPEGNP